jgi:hypothetical protein
MRKWCLPLTVLGLSGLGVLVLTERGRGTLRRLYESLSRAPESLLDWNDAAQHEFDRIQTALARVAASLESAP